MRYMGYVVAFTVAHNLFSAIFFRDDVHTAAKRKSNAELEWDNDVVGEWLSSNGLSQHYDIYSENHITTLLQG